MLKVLPSQPQTSVPKSKFSKFFDEGYITDWLSIYGKNIFYGLASSLVLLLIIFAFSNGQNSRNEQEYIQAANDFALFSKANGEQEQELANGALTRLNSAIGKHPELHAVYDSSLAQIFLNRSLEKEAKPYAEATFARVKSNDLPFYTDYAKTTLLISQKDFKTALENAKTLQEKMNEALTLSTRSFGDELFAFNLLRIAMLHQEVGNQSEELKTWQEWKSYAALNQGLTANSLNPQAFRSIIQQLAIGAFSLPDYIAYRELLLKK